jgi:hypothetical protein
LIKVYGTSQLALLILIILSGAVCQVMWLRRVTSRLRERKEKMFSHGDVLASVRRVIEQQDIDRLWNFSVGASFAEGLAPSWLILAW